MTDDLLGKIFHHLSEAGPLSLRHLLFVSWRFYFAAVNNAHLWTTISLDSSFFSHFNQRREQGNIFVEHCLLRSGSLPLRLYIAFSVHDDPTFLLHLLGKFGKPEWRGFQRCTSLTWNAGGHGATTFQKIVPLLPDNLPSLKHLSLFFFADPMGGLQFPNCPVLEGVKMYSQSWCHPPFWGTNFLLVTTLSFGNHSGWENQGMTTLSQFPALHDLTLFIERDMPDLCPVIPQLPIYFKRLQILRTHGHIPSLVSLMLVTPALKELHLEANAHHFTSISSLLYLMIPLCQHIHALLPEAVSAKEPEWATNLSKLVQKCTKIKSLHISRWMKEECKKFLRGDEDIFLQVQ